ncbi:unnamed protein product [Polarella glacialis]|uniref:C3H1-type domain-containing protein n=1 Tax=Polarella glacialis TaxID=89957 RepID=A0A813HPW7_POLGL|nr:unnamed protein product [Polarella glacialis]
MAMVADARQPLAYAAHVLEFPALLSGAPYITAVKNTFLHFRAASNTSQKVLARSKSSPAIASGTSASHLLLNEFGFTGLPGDTSPPSSQALSLESKMEEHKLGTCQPCAYFAMKADGCRQGADCSFCHFCSAAEVRIHKKSKKRNASEQA